MQVIDLKELYAYHSWATGRIMEKTLQTTPEQFTAAGGASYDSLQRTLVHMVSAEWIWRMRCQEGVSPVAILEVNDFPTPQALVERWKSEQAATLGFLDELQDDDLDRVVCYRRVSGPQAEDVLWHILVHVVNHGTQHRSEAAMLLTRYQLSPGDIDLIWFFRQRGQ